MFVWPCLCVFICSGILCCPGCVAVLWKQDVSMESMLCFQCFSALLFLQCVSESLQQAQIDGPRWTVMSSRLNSSSSSCCSSSSSSSSSRSSGSSR